MVGLSSRRRTKPLLVVDNGLPQVGTFLFFELIRFNRTPTQKFLVFARTLPLTNLWFFLFLEKDRNHYRGYPLIFLPPRQNRPSFE